MSEATAVAIVGILVAGVVGPAVAARFSLRQQEGQQSHERSRDDLADLRILLAEAAKDLRMSEGLLAGTLALLMTWGEQLNVEASGHLEKAAGVGRTVMLNDARIAIRLDEASAIAVAHRDAAAALNRAFDAVALVGGSGGADAKTTYDGLTAAQTDLTDARARFTAAARNEVGNH